MGEVIDFNAARSRLKGKKDNGRCPTCNRWRYLCQCHLPVEQRDPDPEDDQPHNRHPARRGGLT